MSEDRDANRPRQSSITPALQLVFARVKMRTALKYAELDLFTSARQDLIRLGTLDPRQLEFPFSEFRDDDRPA